MRSPTQQGLARLAVSPGSSRVHSSRRESDTQTRLTMPPR